MTESQLQVAVADYIRMQYPNVVFHSDFGSGIKLTKGQAIKQKRQNGGRRAWPDMFLAKPVMMPYRDDEGMIKISKTKYFAGLFIELKKDGVRLKKKNGEWASPHIAEQAEMLEKLRTLNYAAEFAVGFDQAKELIDGYLGLNIIED